MFWKCSPDGVFYPLKPPCQVLNPKFGSEIGPIIYLKLLHGWRECRTVLRSLEWRDLCAVSPLSLWEVISYNSRAGSGSGSGYLRDPSQCHCPHGESLVMPEFLFLVLLLPSRWNHWPVRDLSEEINTLISLDLPPQLLPLCLCASQDVAFPGPLGTMMSPVNPGRMSLKPFHD